jgi:hypothetical protein
LFKIFSATFWHGFKAGVDQMIFMTDSSWLQI